MKAVILAKVADASIIDVSHAVPPFDIGAGAFVLWAGTHPFPPGSIHLAVVDPGVGGSRGRLAFETRGGRFYVGPDNGLFARVLSHDPPARMVSLPRPEGASATFEGRDVFAPAAAALASGTDLGDLGPAYEDVPVTAGGPSGRVIWVDNFGNLITDVAPPVHSLRVGRRAVRRVQRTFSEAPDDQPFVYVGSSGLLEVAVRQGRADKALSAGPGTRVEVLPESGG